MAPDGAIDACHDACCGYRCCDFSQGNYIVLYPGELNEAVAAGAPLAHLEFRPSSDGGHRAVCRASDTATCDGGYKPLDCASYPFFPTADAHGEIEAGLVGAKCPLVETRLARHRGWVCDQWRRITGNNSEVWRWLRRVRLVGYRTIERRRSRRRKPAVTGAPPPAAAGG